LILSKENDYFQVLSEERNNLEEYRTPRVVEEAKFFQFYCRRNELKDITNFTEDELIGIYNMTEPYFHIHRGRGPARKINDMDALLSLLILYKSGLSIKALSHFLRVKFRALDTAISRARIALNEALSSKWLEKRGRPVPLADNQFSHVALLIDATTFPTYRPTGRFEETKHYWDGKNKLYGLKKEVAVSAVAPHVAVFISKGFVASIHDYEFFKKNCKVYETFLRKTPDERRQLTMDSQNSHWGVMVDKGYTGPPEDTPYVRRIFPVKGRYLRPQQVENNLRISRTRVKVEMFFGRLKKSWAITRQPYRFDHSHFDEDMNNCILLTNELVGITNLLGEDKQFYKDWKLLQRHNFLRKKRRQQGRNRAYRESLQVRRVTG
jgi:hypothetical protein